MSTRRANGRALGRQVTWEASDRYARVFTTDTRHLLGWVAQNRRGVWYTMPEPHVVHTFTRRGDAFRWLRGQVALQGCRP